MMKSKDCATATALVIHGYLRANVDHGSELNPNEDRHLLDALCAIRLECRDWSENLKPPATVTDENAVEPGDFTFELTCGGWEAPRSPYNLISAAVSLVREAVDLNGPEIVADFTKRLQAPVAPVTKPEPKQVAHLIEAADTLAAAIDASTERPTAKLEAWHSLIADLQQRGVNVIDRCVAVSQW